MASEGKAGRERRDSWLVETSALWSSLTGCCNFVGAKQIRCIRGIWEPGDEYWEMLLKTRWSGWLEERTGQPMEEGSLQKLILFCVLSIFSAA